MSAAKHIRKRLNEVLRKIEFELQDQPYDRVLRNDERSESALMDLCEYIARNPERKGLVPVDDYAKYPFCSCLIPGYPELSVFQADFWDRYWRIVSWSKREGLMRLDGGV